METNVHSFWTVTGKVLCAQKQYIVRDSKGKAECGYRKECAQGRQREGAKGGRMQGTGRRTRECRVRTKRAVGVLCTHVSIHFERRI